MLDDRSCSWLALGFADTETIGRHFFQANLIQYISVDWSLD